MFSAASKSASGGKLITETFTSNTTWVAPAGVSVLRTMSGFGGAATPDTPVRAGVTFSSVGSAASTFPEPPFAQWSYLYSTMTGAAATVAGGSGVRLVLLPKLLVTVGLGDTWSNNLTSENIWINGTYNNVYATGGALTSGNITYPTASAAWVLEVDTYSFGSNGPATTAVGKTFPGGTLGGSVPLRTAVAPVTTTFTGVAVTPGVSYSFVIPSGGSLTITYIG
jgi:hypothetical protein